MQMQWAAIPHHLSVLTPRCWLVGDQEEVMKNCLLYPFPLLPEWPKFYFLKYYPEILHEIKCLIHRRGLNIVFPKVKINLLLYTQRPKGLISVHLSTFLSLYSTWKNWRKWENKKYILPFPYFSYQFKKYSKSAENFFEKLLCPWVGISPQDLLQDCPTVG